MSPAAAAFTLLHPSLRYTSRGLFWARSMSPIAMDIWISGPAARFVLRCTAWIAFHEAGRPATQAAQAS